MIAAPDGVVAIADAVRSGEIEAASVVTQHLERAEASQATLNAFTLIDGERALERAQTIDRTVAAGDDPGPLAGVPIAVKDLIDHAGRPNTLGSGFPPEVPERSAPAIARLEAAGAIIIGRVGLHEFAFGFSSENHWFGPVRNPWDPLLSPGGSSGGSAVAVAAHLAAAALGTDTGGSVRVPAALCGLVGLKVTHGRVSLRGVYPLSPSVDTVGPLARSVADAAAAYQVIAGHDPEDAWSADRPVTPPGDAASFSNVRIGVPHPWVDAPLVPTQADAYSRALEQLATAGVDVVHIDLPGLAPPGLIIEALYPEVADVHRDRYSATPDGYGPAVGARVAEALAVDPELHQEGLKWRANLRNEVDEVLSTIDFLATPTVAALRKEIGADTVTIGDTEVAYRPALSRFTSLVNQLLLPAIALPLTTPGIPPPSLQLIGPAWSEHRLLELGSAMEAAGMVATQRPTGW